MSTNPPSATSSADSGTVAIRPTRLYRDAGIPTNPDDPDIRRTNHPGASTAMTEAAERPPLATGYSVRAPKPDDVEAVQALTARSDLHEFGEEEGYTVDEIRDEWETIDLERDAWLVIAPDGSIAGYAHMGNRGNVRMDVEGYVHPDHFGRGIGTTLLRLSEGRARENVPLAPQNARVVLHNWISGTNAAACALLERAGYTPARYFLRMEKTLAEAPPPPEWPAGITVRSFVPGEDELRYYEIAEEAMADHWGHVPISFEDWKQRRIGSTFDPSIWFLAEEDGEPAGVALCSVASEIGWVDTLAVRRPWRQRGLGMALLRHAMSEFHRRGLKRVALGVDAANPTGATRLYERAGMHMAQQHATYGKELRPGEEPSDGAS
jgi:mycothiol synthase